MPNLNVGLGVAIGWTTASVALEAWSESLWEQENSAGHVTDICGPMLIECEELTGDLSYCQAPNECYFDITEARDYAYGWNEPYVLCCHDVDTSLLEDPTEPIGDCSNYPPFYDADYLVVDVGVDNIIGGTMEYNYLDWTDVTGNKQLKRTYLATENSCSYQSSYQCKPDHVSNHEDIDWSSTCYPCDWDGIVGDSETAMASCDTDNNTFTCLSGFYRVFTDGYATCKYCPTVGNEDVEEIARSDGSLGVTSCYAPQNVSITDSTGTFKFSYNCKYQN